MTLFGKLSITSYSNESHNIFLLPSLANDNCHFTRTKRVNLASGDTDCNINLIEVLTPPSLIGSFFYRFTLHFAANATYCPCCTKYSITSSRLTMTQLMEPEVAISTTCVLFHKILLITLTRFGS